MSANPYFVSFVAEIDHRKDHLHNIANKRTAVTISSNNLEFCLYSSEEEKSICFVYKSILKISSFNERNDYFHSKRFANNNNDNNNNNNQIGLKENRLFFECFEVFKLTPCLLVLISEELFIKIFC